MNVSASSGWTSVEPPTRVLTWVEICAKPFAGTPSAIQFGVGFAAQGSLTAGKLIPEPPNKAPTVGARKDVEAEPERREGLFGETRFPPYAGELGD